MEFYIAIKKDDALYVLTWKDIHDLVISRKNRLQNTMCYDCLCKHMHYICIYIYMNLKGFFFNNSDYLQEVGLRGDLYFSVLVEYFIYQNNKADSSFRNKMFPE